MYSSIRLRTMTSKGTQTVSLPKRHLKNPYCWLEPLCIFMLIALTCFYYVYDVFYVVPQLFGFLGQTLNFLICTWILYNIFGNLWACYRTTSSVNTLRYDQMQPVRGEEHLWRYCNECDRLMPPRVWHCKICNCCILKRDHHCSFTANCIGHNNQRYYIWLNFHLTFGAGLLQFYNFTMALRHGFRNDFWLPILLVEDALRPSRSDLLYSYLVRTIFYVNLVCLILPMLIFIYQILLVRSNAVSADSSDRKYDLGIGRNFAQVLGNRGFWTMLSPTMESPLPHEGIQWQSKHTV
ncbi:probable palmitoyltransferase ZDHHC24 [Drosophila kikkawai]|uniref:Palmitoyltransferase n=1 Tax=Drosophila kikkawai TaxID=30033 RepID=A0A6P4ISZ5_DROKI|nr:probable palmitoyltransferase ZDHHC24 [Drosophila kikkawai]